MTENPAMAKTQIATSMLATFARIGVGIQATPAAVKPEQRLQLYDIENCPYCRLVREAITELDLDVDILPCPKSGTRFRPQLVERGGKAQFPYLVDPNSGTEIYESLDIVAYLFKTYGQRPLPLKWKLGGLQTFGSMLASAPRMNQGMQADTGVLPKQTLELYSFESSPYARPVRERLCSLEIPYILRSCGRVQLGDWLPPALRDAINVQANSDQGNRRQLQQQQDQVTIPYLYDPNTDHGLFESSAIIDYLDQQYGAVR
jgi:glutathione S-transferase